MKTYACVAAVLLAMLMTACTPMKTKQVAPPPPSFDQLMQQARAHYDAQDVEGAKAFYAKAAAADPTRDTPWLRLAQISFEQKNYGRAIVDAQEVLQRNPTDTRAESIVTVAGLRVAVEALGRLHDESSAQGPAHAEAIKLAEKMRETLGQDVLVPPAAKKPVRRTRPRQAPAAAAATTAPPATAPSAANPFQSLTGGSL